MNFAVFASGRGTNFSAIARAVKRGKIKANLSLLVSDNPKAGALARAKRAGIKTLVVDFSQYPSKAEYEAEIIRNLEKENIELIALAGYMRIVGPELMQKYKNRILNIHPALLPSFKGTHGIEDAFNYGVKVTGVTVHFVDNKMDHGPIILQAPVKIEESDTSESLEAKIHKIEHKLYPEAIRLFVEGKLKIEERKVKII